MRMDGADLIRSLDEQLVEVAPKLSMQERKLLFVEFRGMLAALRAIGEIAPQDQSARQARWAAVLGLAEPQGGDDLVDTVVRVTSQPVGGVAGPGGAASRDVEPPPASHVQQPPLPTT